jgi:hypothetical protein
MHTIYLHAAIASFRKIIVNVLFCEYTVYVRMTDIQYNTMYECYGTIVVVLQRHTGGLRTAQSKMT